MTHVNLGLRGIMHDLWIVHVSLLDQDLTHKDLYSLITEKVLQ